MRLQARQDLGQFVVPASADPDDRTARREPLGQCGAYCKFDRSSPDQLKRLLGAVAAYAAGGRSALLKYGKEQGGAAALLTNQMK